MSAEQPAAVPAVPDEEVVSFKNADGLRLQGTFTRAATGAHGGGGDGGVCAILCHGYASHRNDMALPQIAQALAAAGLNSLRFDFAGNGGSEGVMRFANFQGEVSDVAAAKQFAEDQLGQRVVGLLGHSKGGGVVILYAAQHGDIPRVVNVAGRFEMSGGIAERFGTDIYDRLKRGPVEIEAVLGSTSEGMVKFMLTDEDVRERVAVDIAGACAAIAAAGAASRVLTVHGTLDRAIPVGDARLFAAALPGSRLVIVQDADHNFNGRAHREKLVHSAVTFLAAGG